MYQRMTEQANQPPQMGKDGKLMPRTPPEVYQRQLTAAKADLQLAEASLGELANDKTAAGAANTIAFELRPLAKSNT